MIGGLVYAEVRRKGECVSVLRRGARPAHLRLSHALGGLAVLTASPHHRSTASLLAVSCELRVVASVRVLRVASQLFEGLLSFSPVLFSEVCPYCTYLVQSITRVKIMGFSGRGSKILDSGERRGSAPARVVCAGLMILALSKEITATRVPQS